MKLLFKPEQTKVSLFELDVFCEPDPNEGPEMFHFRKINCSTVFKMSVSPESPENKNLFVTVTPE